MQISYKKQRRGRIEEISYSNDIVAGMVLQEESKGIYNTGRGSMIGDSKSKLKKEYSEKYAIDKVEKNLD